MSTTLEIGQTLTTAKSGVVGIIKAVDNDVNGTERWTSVSN